MAPRFPDTPTPAPRAAGPVLLGRIPIVDIVLGITLSVLFAAGVGIGIALVAP